MRTISSYLLSLLFLVAIGTPLAVMQFSDEETVSLTEKRKLAEKPSLHLSLQSLGSFPQEYENYFNDHFGLRSKLVYVYNALFVTFFQTSPKSHTVIGKDKWLFLAAEHVITDFMGMYPFDDNKLHHWKQVLHDREEWLADQGIQYLFIPAPNKVMIYPEYLPNRIFKKRGTTNLEQFLDHLAKPPSFTNVLDLRQPLLDAKKENQLYHKGDTHWNFDGAYVGYVSIIEAIRQWFPEFTPIPKEHLVRTFEKMSGDLTYTLNLAEMYAEDISILTLPEAEKLIQYQNFAGHPQPDTPFQKFRRGVLFTNENPSRQRTAVFISDSFGSALRNFLAPHFKRIIFVKDARFEDMKRLIEIEKPDIVLDLNVARGLYVALGENIEIRDYVLHKHHAERRIVLDINQENLKKRLSHSSQVDLDSEKILRASGGDPQLYFDLPSQASSGILNIYCQISSPMDTLFKLYYQTADHKFYSEAKKVFHNLRKGTNSFYLRIYEPILLDKLRLDPGEHPGEYSLERFTISSE
ncbi:MAG: hypothetical protein VR65_13040 [Desulfobulbaceae bacterium BRH_c16a]|nr:MAG: hypothetical protein VR65_13040 [Desulfobulbaceae bacterium BRH_c16a]